MKKHHSKDAVKRRGEIFTPPELVEEMLDSLPQELFKDNKTFLDNSCGSGAFLYAVLLRKMANGFTHEEALEQIYGVELDKANTTECRKRLCYAVASPTKRAAEIIKNNIICADALNPNHKGWREVGYYWNKEVIKTTV